MQDRRFKPSHPEESVMDQKGQDEQNLPKIKIEELSDFIEKLSTPSLTRNELCYCGSNKKYKKCCLEKLRKNPSIMRLESFTIKTDSLTPEESKNNYTDLSEEDKDLMTNLYHNFHKHPELIDSEDCEYFQKLDALRIKYPDNPVILNYITNGYDLLGHLDRVEKLIEETYEKFPNYLFAQTAQANVYLRGGFPEKAIEVLKGAFTLKQLYPHRNVFHITEVSAFENCMVKYFCMIRDLKQAERHLKILQQILDEDNNLLHDAQRIFRNANNRFKWEVGMSRLANQIKKTKN